MKRIALILSIIFINYASSQERDLLWQNSLGGSEDDAATTIKRTIDGGYILTGGTNSNNGDVSGNHGSSDVWVIKLSESGEIQWQKCLGGSNGEIAHSIILTNDEGYMVVGQSNSNDGDVSDNHGEFDAWIVKLSSLGEIQWQKSLGGSERDIGYSIIQTLDEGYIMGGITESNDGDVSGNHGFYDVWVVKLTINGEIEWQKCLGGTEWEDAYTVLQTTDGGYILAGDTISTDGDITNNQGYVDVWVIKLSSNGVLEWQKTYGGSGSDVARSAIQTTDGGYILSCDSWSWDGDITEFYALRDVWILKISELGEIEWQKTYGGSKYEYAYSIIQTQDGGYAFAGATNSNDFDVSGNHSDEDDVWVVKINQEGQIEWQQCLGGTKWESGNSIIEISENNFVVAGYTHSNDGDVSGNHSDELDAWVVKIDNLLNTETLLIDNSIIIYPNPVTNTLKFNSNSNLLNTEFIIYDNNGKNVLKGIIDRENISISIAHFTKGIYYLKIKNNKAVKFIKN